MRAVAGDDSGPVVNPALGKKARTEAQNYRDEEEEE